MALAACRYAFAIAWVAACGGDEAVTLEQDDPVPETGGPTECDATDPFAEAVLAADIDYLASDELRGRAPATPADDATLAWIDERFHCLGLDAPTGDGSHRVPFTTSDDRETANVVGILPGGELADEIVVVGAHHDHLGTKDGDVFNGANDNASGVAALLAIASSMTSSGVVPRRTIAFVTFGFEEHDGDCEGSESFVARPPEGIAIDDVVYMFDLDMLGSYPSEGTMSAYGAIEGTPARELLAARMTDYPELSVDLDLQADEDASDFQAFCDVGIPYLYFETWDLECYHSPCDDADLIDYPSLSTIARLSADVLSDLANTDTDLLAVRGTEASGCAP